MHPILISLFLAAATHTGPLTHSTIHHAHPHSTNSDWTAVRRQLSAQEAEIALLRRQIAQQDAEITQIRRQIGQKVAEADPHTHHTRQLALSTTNVYDLVLSGSYPQAARAANDILAHDPDNTEAQALKAIACVKTGQIDAARAAAATALQTTDGQQGRPRALALIAAGLLAEAANNTNAATQAYQSAGNTDSTLGLVYLIFADLLHKHGKDDLAKRILQTGLTQNHTPEEANALQSTLDKM